MYVCNFFAASMTLSYVPPAYSQFPGSNVICTDGFCDLSVQVVTLSKEDAEKTGALHFFGDKYGEQVTVYFVGENIENAYSKEFCGGPHVKNSGDLKGKFRIQKEEAVSAGVRRIKAVLE